jgi:acyl carrier protein
MNKVDIYNRINEIIYDENGEHVPKEGLFKDSGLDSLGITIALITLDSEFPILGDDQENGFKDLDIPNLTMRDLVNKCKLSITNTSTEQSTETDT